MCECVVIICFFFSFSFLTFGYWLKQLCTIEWFEFWEFILYILAELLREWIINRFVFGCSYISECSNKIFDCIFIVGFAQTNKFQKRESENILIFADQATHQRYKCDSSAQKFAKNTIEKTDQLTLGGWVHMCVKEKYHQINYDVCVCACTNH